MGRACPISVAATNEERRLSLPFPSSVGADPMYQQSRIEVRIAREVGVILLLLVFALVQIALLPRPLGFVPPFMLVIVVCRALVSGANEGMRWAFYGGLALDICIGSLLGSHALALLVPVILIMTVMRSIRVEHWLFPIASVFVATMIYEGILGFLYAWFTTPIEWQSYAIVVIIPSAVLAIIPALPIYMVIRQLSRWRQEYILEE